MEQRNGKSDMKSSIEGIMNLKFCLKYCLQFKINDDN